MDVSLVAAVDKNGVIGLEGRLPWRIPADLKRFRALTMGKPVIMGRKTYESIGKALFGRTNIVITRDRRYEAPGCFVVHSITEALRAAGNRGEIMIIGGGGIYQQFIHLASKVYLTEIEASFEGDVFFPEMESNLWSEISRESVEAGSEQPYTYHFVVYNRIDGGMAAHLEGPEEE